MQKLKITKNLIVKPSNSIKYVMTRLSESNYRFQLVVSKNKLLGTVVDGDIRRSILKGQ
ncbi:MAG: alcohol dehydrogenase, partial [Porticoccaceae bacterium]|nr:alcohol dehydrogenase [Porticoccaceae bacterium]